VADEKRILQLNELDVLHLEAYESSKIYKESTKQRHDKPIINNRFEEGDLVLLLNSKLRLFPGKLRSRWSRPFESIKVFPHETVEVWSESTCALKVNGQRLKCHVVGEPTIKLLSTFLQIPSHYR